MDQIMQMIVMLALMEAADELKDIDEMTDEEVEEALLDEECDCTKCNAKDSCPVSLGMMEARQEVILKRKLQDIPPDMDMHRH